MPNLSNKPIRVRLDHRTVITILKIESLDKWKTRYPDAQIISQEEYTKSQINK